MADKKTTIEIELETMAYGGSALGRHEGRVVFVPYAIPGEVVEAEIIDDRGRIAFARGVRLLDASADRVYPACAHFGPGKCVGCHWQHISYEAQLLIKQDVLADQLERIGGFADVNVRGVIPSNRVWGYNDHMKFEVGSDGTLGFANTEGNMIPIDVCEVLHPELMDLYTQLDINTEGIASVRLMRGSMGDRMLILQAAGEEAPELELDLAASVNLLLPDKAPINLAGDTHLNMVVGGRTFRVTAGSYYRQNSEMAEQVVAAVIEALGDANAVLDLYAGVGLLGAFAAENADYVTLVESYPPAATDADDNTAEYDHVDVIEGSVEDVLESAEDEYDTIIVNPPGSGLSTEAIDLLSNLSVARLVYVSTDAATFSRDAKRLRTHGFELDYVQPIDMAPHTYHLETVACFNRSKKRAAKSA